MADWKERVKKFIPLAASALVLVAAIFVVIFKPGTRPDESFDYTTLLGHVQAGDVQDITIDDGVVSGQLKGGSAFHTDLTNTGTQAALAEKLAAAKVPVRFAAPSKVDPVQATSAVVMVLAVGGLFYFVAKKSAISFGNERRQAVEPERCRVRFSDVDGVDEAKQELAEIVDFLREPGKFTRLGGRIPRGVLLSGPPGTGKTLLARAVAGEAGVPFFSISGSEFVEMYVGVGARRVRSLFARARKSAPCIVFIDEIDAIGRHRGGPSSGHNEEREQSLNQLLVEMDGFDATAGIVVIAATNRQDILDTALLRPGRFDRRVVVDHPDIRGRESILKVHTRKTPLAREVDLRKVARGTPGFSGADLANLVNEAVLSAARNQRDQVSAADFEAARDKVIMGAERTSAVMTESDRVRIAVHEAGHALAALDIPGSDPVHKISIIPRGMALGVTMQLPENDRLMYSKEYLEGQIAMLLAGRLAEETLLNNFASGSANDIERATSIARKMVRQLGMSRLGPVVCLERGPGGAHHDFLSEFSAQTEQRIDEEVERILTTQMARAREILLTRKEALARLRDVLLEEETIDSERFKAVVAEASVQRVPATETVAA